jgi:iron complex outermembrane recepter protein
VELDLGGEILPGWKIAAATAYIDAKISDDNTFTVGNRLNNAPEFSASLWSTYEIQSGGLKGLGFGLGAFFVGERQGDLANSFQVPSYLRTDAALFYRLNKVRFALNFENLFGVRYFENAESDLRVFPGAPFTVKGTVSVQF